MMRCLQLAEMGAGQVSPNPLVGAVLVHVDRIIGEGWHQGFGGPHAEVNALRSVSDEDSRLIPLSTLYVSLEPCAHHGKTPPCADMIIASGIRRVVIGCEDPFPAVNGKGIEKMQEAGIDVTCGVLKSEAEWMNRRFLTFQRERRPYIILKWAQTVDGFMGRVAERIFITQDATNRLVHRWRTEEDAILVGTNTALLDDPQLTSRHWPGRDPLRMVIDRKDRLPSDLRIFCDGGPVVVFHEGPEMVKIQVRYMHLDPAVETITQILEHCFRLGVQSLIVEGGAAILQSFIDRDFWDEMRIITNLEMELKAGIQAPVLPSLVGAETFILGHDRVLVGFRRQPLR